MLIIRIERGKTRAFTGACSGVCGAAQGEGGSYTKECIQKVTVSSTLAIMRTWPSWEMT